MRAKKIRRCIIIVVLLLILAIVLVPLLWCIVLSFDRKAVSALPEFSLIPHEFSIFNYQVAFTTIPLVRYYLNTIFVTVVHTVLAVFFALMCGYAFAKGRFIGKNFWFVFMLAVMMIPFESRMVPLYLQYKSWGLLDTYAPLLMGPALMCTESFFPDRTLRRFRIPCGSRLILTEPVNGGFFSRSLFLYQSLLLPRFPSCRFSATGTAISGRWWCFGARRSS